MCLEYHGCRLDERAIVQACGSSPIGTSLEQAVAGLEDLGFAGEIHEDAEADLLAEQLAVGQPVVVAMWAGVAGGRPVRHAVVLSGWDEGRVYFADPSTGAEASLSEAEFIRGWSRAGSQALVIYRP